MRITTWGAPRALGALLVLSLLALMVAAGGSAARPPQVAAADGLVQPAWTPLGLRDAKTTVMVQVAGEPVASVEGNANRELSDAEKNQIESNLKATQAGVRRPSKASAARSSPTTRPPTTASRSGSTATRPTSSRTSRTSWLSGRSS